MDDTGTFEAASRERASAVAARARPARTGAELAPREPIDIYHWAAVALVTALMCAVLGYAAGTAALARAANVTSLVFGVLGGALMASGIVRRLRVHFSMDNVGKALGVAETHRA